MGIYEKVTEKDDAKSINKVFTAESATILSEGWSDSGSGPKVLNTSHTLPTPKIFKIILFKCKKIF